jgi:hypothetical protein
MGLKYSDLKVGDVLLKHSAGSKTNVAIKAGEALISHNASGGTADIVHAAIFAGNFGGQQVIFEASGPGLIREDMSGNGYSYEVYRYKEAKVASIAAMVAEGYVAETNKSKEANPQDHYGAYTITGAVGSLFHSSSRGDGAQAAEGGLWGKSANPADDKFYCSNFVVRAYQAAGQTFDPKIVPIDADYRYISPKEMQARLNKSADWSHPGQIIG